MDFDSLLQLGALGFIAVLMIIKDSKRDAFIEQLVSRMSDSLDGNTKALVDLREEFRKGSRK